MLSEAGSQRDWDGSTFAPHQKEPFQAGSLPTRPLFSFRMISPAVLMSRDASTHAWTLSIAATQAQLGATGWDGLVHQ